FQRNRRDEKLRDADRPVMQFFAFGMLRDELRRVPIQFRAAPDTGEVEMGIGREVEDARFAVATALCRRVGAAPRQSGAATAGAAEVAFQGKLRIIRS